MVVFRGLENAVVRYNFESVSASHRKKGRSLTRFMLVSRQNRKSGKDVYIYFGYQCRSSSGTRQTNDLRVYRRHACEIKQFKKNVNARISIN